MRLMIISIIILLIIILICTYNKISYFTIKTDIISDTLEKKIEEVFNYPTCIDTHLCVSNNNELKPKFKYNISDERCINNDSILYHPKTDLDGIINYTITNIPNYYKTCSTGYNSMYSSIIGKYIMIYRPDNVHIKFDHISIHERNIFISSLSSATGTVIFSTNLYSVNGNNIYPEITLNPNNSITFENNGTSQPFSKIIMTLPYDNNNIGYINIVHNNINDAETLNGARLFILKKQDGSSDDNPYADIVFYKNIDTTEINRIIYTYNFLNTPLPDDLEKISVKINNDWILPCNNCSSMSGNLFKYHTYTKNDTRCYVPLLNNIPISDLINEPNIFTLSTKYKSCKNIFDTHYPIPNGHILYITKNSTSEFSIILNNIKFYSNYDKNIYDISEMINFCAYVESYDNDSDLFENIIDLDNINQLITKKNTDTKIIINFGQSIFLSGIQIDVPIENKDNLLNMNLYLINIDSTDVFNTNKMKVTGLNNITQEILDTTFSLHENQLLFTYLFPIIKLTIDRDVSDFNNINIINSVTYSITDKYLTTYKKNNIYYQIPYLNYTFLNGRSIFATTLVDSTTTLDLINNSDPITLYNFRSNVNMKNILGYLNSHLLTPCSARFIKISQPDTTLMLNNSINNINIYDINNILIKSILNPVVIYEVPNDTYSQYLTTSDIISTDGFILIDIGYDANICFINIIINNIPSLINANLDLINDLGNKKFTTILNPVIDTLYIITDMNIINEIGTFFLKKFNYPDCLNNLYCPYAISDAYYILPKLCFKAINNINCDSDCMRDISNYNFDNRIIDIDNKFTSCNDFKETRYAIMFTWDASANIDTMLNVRNEPALTIAAIRPLVYIPGNEVFPIEQSGNNYTIDYRTMAVDGSVENALYQETRGVLYTTQVGTKLVPTTFENSPKISIFDMPNIGLGDFTIILNYKQPQVHVPAMNNLTTYKSARILSYGTVLSLTPVSLSYGYNYINYRSNPLFNTWTLIILTYTISNRVLTLYVDNVNKGTLSVTFPNIIPVPVLTLYNINPANNNQKVYWFNGYIADFKIYRNYIISIPYIVTAYDPNVYSSMGDHVVNWKPTNYNNNLSLVMSNGFFNFIKSIKNGKYYISKQQKQSIIYLNSNIPNFIRNIKCFSFFLVYNIPNTPTQIKDKNRGNIISAVISFNGDSFIPINLYMKNDNLMLSADGPEFIVVSNYTYFGTDDIDVLGIQIINTNNVFTVKFINNNNDMLIQTFIESTLKITYSELILLNIGIGAIPNVNFQYYDNGIEINIYEFFINGILLTDIEFKDKHTQLYNKWVL